MADGLNLKHLRGPASVTCREFLASTTALAFGLDLLAQPRLALAREVMPQSPDSSLDAAAGRYTVSLEGPVVALDCLPLASSPGIPPIGATVDPLVSIGPNRQPVQWQAAAEAATDRTGRFLVLKAPDLSLEADVSFACDEATGFVTARTLLRHIGGMGPLDITASCSFAARLHEPIERIIYLSGGWQEETDIQRADPANGAIMLESRAGKTGFDFQPYVALRTQSATWLCQIMWSGNWQLRIVPGRAGATLLAGFNNWQFRHRLRAGKSLALPTVIFGRFDGSLDGATRRLHDYRRARRPDPDRLIPVQFNSWYPFLGEPSAELLMPLVPIVKRLGCEAFVVDAGWYRTDEGESDADWDQRTGDWRVSRQRFPGGLQAVSSQCHDAGMRFGLWFEPEVIGPASSIRRTHPEWLHHIDGKPPATDTRAVLNLGVPQAWQHVFDRISGLLHLVGVDWMKWDFNTDLGAGGWAPSLPEEITDEAPLVAHYTGLYRLQDAIRAEFPDLILEMCAGGGGRMDGGILSHAHVNWMSDQSSALRKLAIHFGSQLAHPAVVCNDWLIDWPGDDGRLERDALVDPHGDLAFRLRVAMLGTFGISAPVDRWSEADIEMTAVHVELYKGRIRRLVHHGDQYLLTCAPQGDGDWAAVWYAAKNGRAGALFAFRLASPEAARTFSLHGLRGDHRYRVSFVSGPSSILDGKTLEAEFRVELPGTYQSALCLIEVLPDGQQGK